MRDLAECPSSLEAEAMLAQFDGNEAELRDALQDYVLASTRIFTWQELCSHTTQQLIGLVQLIVDGPLESHRPEH